MKLKLCSWTHTQAKGKRDKHRLEWASNIISQSIESSAFCRRSLAEAHRLSFYSPDQCHRQLTVQAGLLLLLLLLTCIVFFSFMVFILFLFLFIYSLAHTHSLLLFNAISGGARSNQRSLISTSGCHFLLLLPLLRSVSAATGHV